MLAAAIVVTAVAALELGVLALHGAGSLDAVLWPSVLEFPADRFTVGTAFSFLLVTVCCAQLVRGKIHARAFVGASTLGLVLCAFALVGYALDRAAPYGAIVLTTMALHSAIAFAVLFVCLMLAAPRHGWISLLLGSRAGSSGVRRLVPIILAGPLLLCGLAVRATEAALFNDKFRLSVMVLLVMAIGLSRYCAMPPARTALRTPCAR